MRCLIAVLPLPTHLYPLVPLARALVRGGHDVCIATASALSGLVTGLGLEHLPAGENWPDIAAEEGHDPGAARALEYSLKRRMFTSTLESMFTDVRTSLAQRKADVVLIEPFAM